MIDHQSGPQSLLVADSMICNTQRSTPMDASPATVPATPAQRGTLKALALLALDRNASRNADATPSENPCNEWCNEDAESLRGKLVGLAERSDVDRAVVLQLRADDIAAAKDLPMATVRDWLRIREIGQLLDRGIVPPGYSKAVECVGCGPVLLWPTCPNRVLACPWCFRRKAGKAIPRPAKTPGG